MISLGECLAHQLHHQETNLPGLLKPMERGNFGMVQRSKKAGLPLEAGQTLEVLGEGFGKNFDGDFSAELVSRAR